MDDQHYLYKHQYEQKFKILSSEDRVRYKKNIKDKIRNIQEELGKIKKFFNRFEDINRYEKEIEYNQNYLNYIRNEEAKEAKDLRAATSRFSASSKSSIEPHQITSAAFKVRQQASRVSPPTGSARPTRQLKHLVPLAHSVHLEPSVHLAPLVPLPNIGNSEKEKRSPDIISENIRQPAINIIEKDIITKPMNDNEYREYKKYKKYKKLRDPIIIYINIRTRYFFKFIDNIYNILQVINKTPLFNEIGLFNEKSLNNIKGLVTLTSDSITLDENKNDTLANIKIDEIDKINKIIETQNNHIKTFLENIKNILNHDNAVQFKRWTYSLDSDENFTNKEQFTKYNIMGIIKNIRKTEENKEELLSSYNSFDPNIQLKENEQNEDDEKNVFEDTLDNYISNLNNYIQMGGSLDYLRIKAREIFQKPSMPKLPKINYGDMFQKTKKFISNKFNKYKNGSTVQPVIDDDEDTLPEYDKALKEEDLGEDDSEAIHNLGFLNDYINMDSDNFLYVFDAVLEYIDTFVVYIDYLKKDETKFHVKFKFFLIKMTNPIEKIKFQRNIFIVSNRDITSLNAPLYNAYDPICILYKDKKKNIIEKIEEIKNAISAKAAMDEPLKSVKGGRKRGMLKQSNKPVKKTAKAVVKKIAKAVVKKTAKAVVKKTAKAVVKKTAKAVVKKIAKAVVKKTAKAVVKKTAKAVVKKTAKAVVKKTAKAVVKKIAKAVVKK
jgi:hypothetical protein